MLGSETGGSGRAGKFWKGWDGGEQGAEQHLSGLAPAYMENDVGEAIARSDLSHRNVEKVCSQQNSSWFIHEFWCWSSAAWGRLLPSASRGGKRRYPLGNAPCLYEEMFPCTFRPTLQDHWVQDSGAFLGLPNPQVLPLISLSCHHLPKGWGHPWQGDHSWGNKCFVWTVGVSGTKPRPRICWCTQIIADICWHGAFNNFQV